MRNAAGTAALFRVVFAAIMLPAFSAGCSLRTGGTMKVDDDGGADSAADADIRTEGDSGDGLDTTPDADGADIAEIRDTAEGRDSHEDDGADADMEPECVPECGDRQCGLDPVCFRELCGTCNDPYTCDGTGMCTCAGGGVVCGSLCCDAGQCCVAEMCITPYCDPAWMCGDDGCDGACGGCDSGQCCIEHTCITPFCNPDWACGRDKCGNLCSSCPNETNPPDCLFCMEHSCVAGSVCDETACCWPFEYCDGTGHCTT
ncbi:MAG: hypothetical protein ABIJ56_16305 [Pseudomonadota bacterium]